MSTAATHTARALPVSHMAEALIGSEIIKLAAEINEKIRNGETVYNLTIGDFNPKMVNVAKSLGDTFVSRKLATYRYLFDRGKEFKRHPILS